MRKTKLVVSCVSSLIIASALLIVAACAPSAPPGEKTVAYLSLADYTGPVAGLNVPGDTGCSDMFKEINEQGGVDGVKINAIFIDTRYDTARGVSAYKRYRTEPKLLVVNAIKTDVSKAIDPMTVRDKVVRLAIGDGEFQAKIGWCFLSAPAYQNAFGAAIDFILADWKAKGKAGAPTLGYMYWDIATGREQLRGGKEYAEKMGVNLLPPDFFPLGASEFTVVLSRIAHANPDYCTLGGVDPTPSLIMRDAAKLGLTEKIQFIDITYFGPTEAVGLKLHPEACEGAWMTSYCLRGDEAWSLPLAQYMVPKYREKSVDEFRKSTPPHYLAGMNWALIYQEGLKRALQDVGYEKLDGEAMKRAYESLTGLNLSQGFTGPCTYSPTSRQGSDTVKFYQVQNGKEVPISDWRKAPDCVSLHDWSK